MTEAKKALVSVQRCGDYEPEAVAEALARVLEPLGGMAKYVKPGDSVLLKPNLIVPRKAEEAVTTHPEVIRAVAREVLAAGGKPYIADSPAFGTARSVAEACGILRVADELGIEIREMGERARSVRIATDGHFRKATLGAAALDAGVIVNLPKVKTHVQMVMTLGLKNLFGAVAGKRKPLFHFRNGPDRVRFAELLVAITRTLAPVLTIEDAIVALERHGPTHGDPRCVGVLAASSDVTAVDRVLLEILGVAPEKVPAMVAAERLGYGCASLDEIEVVGETIDAVRLRDYVQVADLDPINFSLAHVVRSVVRQVYRLAMGKLRLSSS